jgi:hypothetical protein
MYASKTKKTAKEELSTMHQTDIGSVFESNWKPSKHIENVANPESTKPHMKVMIHANVKLK